MQADIICYCKMTLFMRLDGVTLFLRLKAVTNTCKHIRRGQTIWRDFFIALVESWKKLKTSNVFSSFIVC